MSKIISVLPSQDHYVFHTDPGHGWLEVPRKLIDTLGIAGAISAYSYQKGDMAYLEEDCDAPRFLKALEDHPHAAPYTLKEVHQDPCYIRSYPRFRA